MSGHRPGFIFLCARPISVSSGHFFMFKGGVFHSFKLVKNLHLTFHFSLQVVLNQLFPNELWDWVGGGASLLCTSRSDHPPGFARTGTNLYKHVMLCPVGFFMLPLLMCTVSILLCLELFTRLSVN